MEDLPGTAHIPNLAALNSKVLGLQQATSEAGNQPSSTRHNHTSHHPQEPSSSAPAGSQSRVRKEIPSRQGHSTQDGRQQENSNQAGRAAAARHHASAGRSHGEDESRGESEGDEMLSEIEAMMQEEDAVAAAGAAASMSAHALSALDLFVGSSSQVRPSSQTMWALLHSCRILEQCKCVCKLQGYALMVDGSEYLRSLQMSERSGYMKEHVCPVLRSTRLPSLSQSALDKLSTSSAMAEASCKFLPVSLFPHAF